MCRELYITRSPSAECHNTQCTAQIPPGLTQQTVFSKQSLQRKLHGEERRGEERRGEEDEELLSSHLVLISHFNSPDWARLNLSQQKKNNLFRFFAKLWTIQGGRTNSDYVATCKVFTAAGQGDI